MALLTADGGRNVAAVEDAEEYAREFFRHFAGPYTRAAEAILVSDVRARFRLRREEAAAVVEGVMRPFEPARAEREAAEAADRRGRLRAGLALCLALALALALWSLAAGGR